MKAWHVIVGAVVLGGAWYLVRGSSASAVTPATAPLPTSVSGPTTPGPYQCGAHYRAVPPPRATVTVPPRVVATGPATETRTGVGHF